MKRSAIVIAATAAGLAAVISFKPHGIAGGTQAAASAAALTTANGKIASVGMAQINLHGPQSQQISNNVIPQLEQQVMASNGGPIHGVSGATYTSRAFGSSLQAALSQLKGGANAQLAAAGNGIGGLVQPQGGQEHDD